MKKSVTFVLAALALPSAAAEPADPCAPLVHTAIAAALGQPADTYNLAVEFYTGQCVTQNHENAAILWEKAAASGIVAAKNNLAFLFYQGLGVPKDSARAVALWSEAAQAGHVEAQLHLGDALFYGDGAPKDQVRGLAWVLLAAERAEAAVEPGAGPELIEMAREGKAELLRENSAILLQAESVKAELAAALAER